MHAPSRRGILAEHDLIKNSFYLYLPIKDKLYKINLNDGQIIKDFGKNGHIPISTITAPMIYGENLVVSTTQAVFSYNKYTGEKKKQNQLSSQKKFFRR